MSLMSRLKPVLNRAANDLQERFYRHRERHRLRLQQKQDATVEDQAQSFRVWMWSSAFALSLIVIFTVVSNSANSANSKTKVIPDTGKPAVSFLESLPEGFVVAPIEPVNSESLDSLLDEHGYADLYRSRADGEKDKRIARGLPLIRAPRNPRQFAVIVPEHLSEHRTELLSELSRPVVVILRKGPPKTSEKRASKKIRPRKVVRSKVEIVAEEGFEWADVEKGNDL